MAQLTDLIGTNGSNLKIPQTADIKMDAANGKPTATAEVKSAPKINVRLITKEDLNRKIESREDLQIVNVLDPEFYKLGFIKGSKRIPFHELDARLGELDKSKEVITYCASRECNASKHAAELLAGKGFRVTAYEGGIKEWKEAGLPTDAE